MLKIKHFVYILILISITACKSGPTAEEGQVSSAVNSPSVNSEVAASNTPSEAQASVISTADTGGSS